ncbi:neuromedin-U isoform X1 [Fukomys damarensis]|uniref:neuromedin-U isoform X1 n=1 Tax=Fukomys damarensis TaxID=885580 RepID=UPI001455BE18|nr:neuromedin-U isoform X1 [Fukomys damarensis]
MSSLLQILEKCAPILPQGLWSEQELQSWNKINDVCSSFLAIDSQPQASTALRDLCFMAMGILPKPQEQDEKDNTKRFLFHYSKTQKLGNSNVVSSIVHPLLQLVPQLHERRMKRFQVDSLSFTRKGSKVLFQVEGEATFYSGHAMGGQQVSFKMDAN